MSNQTWLDSLNDKQLEAVTYRAAPLLVLAGPGSGKTRILTNRIAWIIRDQGAQPESILAVTFTNRAAEEMRDRLFTLLGEQASHVWVYTFHATAVRILRRFGEHLGLDPNFAIIDEDEQRQAVNRIIAEAGLSREIYPVHRISNYISKRKNALKDPRTDDPTSDAALVEVARQYENWLIARKSLDFDDLIRYAVTLLRQYDEVRAHYHRTLKHVLVDEYQDINTSQYELLKLLAPVGSSITIVADDDQSIYGWRGSRPELIDDFIERYRPYVVKLDLSYRCPPAILYGAQRLITHQRSEERQRFMHSNVDGDAPIFHYIFHDIHQEQRWLVTLVHKLIEDRGYKPSDIGVLYRTHRLANSTEQALLQAGFKVHRLRKESFFDQPIARDVVRYLQLARLLSEDNFTAAVNFPRKQIDELTMIQLRRLMLVRDINFVELVRRIDRYPEISPLTRAHLRQFLQFVEGDLPRSDEDAGTSLLALFKRLNVMRSPWRSEDRELLYGFMRFTDLVNEAEALSAAIDDERPIVILHPATIDGYAAAAILHMTLRDYLGIDTLTTTDSDPDDFAPDAALVVLGDSGANLTETIQRQSITLGAEHASERPYTLATYAWRCAQLLLIGYETLADGRFVVYDVETTGTNIRRDELVEIAAATYENQQLVDEDFHHLICPARGYIPRAATRIHGIHFQDVADAPSVAQVLPEFLDYVDNETMVGHNITRFDNRFLDRATGKYLDGQGFNPFCIDTLRLARRLLPDHPRYTLESLAKTLDVGDKVLHRAEDDLRLTAQVFFALTEYIIDEKEREALVEFLPLVGLSALAENVDLVDENLSLMHGAARMLTAGRGRPQLAELLDSLPAAIQLDAFALSLKLESQVAPITTEDEDWKALQEAFFQHVEAFQRYGSDDSLASFLDYQALLRSVDTSAHTHDGENITLMTLHNAKGVEFPIVIIIGVEQENLPLWRTLNDPKQVAEERRVLYVGITRAKDAVYLFSTRNRNDGFLRNPSRFAFEIPPEYIRRIRVGSKGRVQELS
jgi:DNA polymerase III epsilon subunit family exonuclease